MKKTKKLLALSVSLVMTAAIFTGCSADGLSLFTAFGKTNTINSMQSKTDMSLKVSGVNMSAQEEEMMGAVLPMINGTKMSVLTKTIQNEDKTIAKMQSDIALNLTQMPEPINMSMWVDVDSTGDEPVVNEVFKMPQLLTAQFPKELQGKDYMVMNIADMTSVPGTPQVNYEKLMSFSKEFQPEFLDFMVKYAKQFNPATDYIKHVGSQTFTEHNVKKSTDTYEIKLTDKSFKDLMHYTLNNLAENTDAMNFVQKYMTSVMSIYDVTDAENKNVQDEMNNAFGNLATDLPKALLSLDKSLDSIEDLKILGDNGIKIRYTVNENGYIIKEKGNAEFVIDLPGIIKLAGNAETVSNPSYPTGIYTISLDFDTDITNINGDVDIEFPSVNSTNSFNYNDILKMIPATVPVK
ncbi:MAG: hypothetical protein ACI8WT_001228 [Clostridium sp.]|jgi:hypothetical protein